jgi:hypothetical protein
MGQMSLEPYVDLAADGMRDVAQAFADEIGRKPSLTELLEILTWALRSCRDDALSDVHPANIIALRPRVPKDAKGKSSGTDSPAVESAVQDLNDSVFVIASGFLSRLFSAIKADSGLPPSRSDLCDLFTKALQVDSQLVADLSSRNIVGLEAEVRKSGKVVPKVGDVIAIPAKDGQFFVAVILDKNVFGTAYGFFEGTAGLRPVSVLLQGTPKRHAIYTGDQLVASGRWKIIGHDEKLLTLFPREHEIYHYPQSVPGNPQVGPYGSGETPSGRLRNLTKEEAQELGIVGGKYRQGYTPQYLETYLNSELG